MTVVFWVFTACSKLCFFWCFGEIYCIHL